MAKMNKNSSNTNTPIYKNPLEMVKDLGSSTVKKTVNSLSDIGSGVFDQLTGNYEDNETDEFNPQKFEQQASKSLKKEKKVFSFQEHSENTLIKQKIAELTELIKREIEALKKQGSEFSSELSDIEKIALNDLPEKPGIYHVRFLEIVLSFIRNLRAKVGESRTWLNAMMSKKKKRGSLFAVRSKKAGTQYSLSQELQSSRSVQ